jgi:uncharacterized protein YaaQ
VEIGVDTPIIVAYTPTIDMTQIIDTGKKQMAMVIPGINDKRLDGKIAVVTGGNSGIGLATAQRFVEEGAFVFITGRRQSALDTAVEQIGENVRGVQGDVSNLDDLDRLYDTVKQQKGRIDVLFANAGVPPEFAQLGTITESNFDQTFSVNERNTVYSTKSAPAVSGWWFHHSKCFYSRIQRSRGVQCLRCH